MPLVKIKDKFQVTIPASIRKAAELDIGDFLEAEVREDGILLTPKTLTDRNALLKKFRKVFSEANPDKTFAGKSDDALMKIATKEIKETRTAKKSKK
ncbi:MAG: AbrB/MazE/SpoVT family DNA-binding domain-containing protein [Desulfosalsimonadaceae bacterium]